MHNSTTALLKALLTNNEFVTIESDRIRFWIGNRSDIEVIITGDIAQTDGLRGVIAAELLRAHVKASKTLALSLYNTEIKIGDKVEYPVTVQMVPDHGTFKVPSIEAYQLPIAGVSTTQTIGLSRDDIKTIIAANDAAGNGERAEHFGTWLAEGYAVATNGHRLEKRKIDASLPEAMLIPSVLVKALAKIKAQAATVSFGSRGEQRVGEIVVAVDGSSVQFRWLPLPSSDMPPLLTAGNAFRFDVAIPLDWRDAWKLGAPMTDPRFGIFRNGGVVVWDHKNNWIVGTHFPAKEIPDGEPFVVLTNDALATFASTKQNTLYVASDSSTIRVRDRIVMACSTSAKGEAFSTALPEGTRAAVARLYDTSPCPPMTAGEAKAHAAHVANLDAIFTWATSPNVLARVPDQPKEAMATKCKKARTTVATMAAMTRDTVLPRIQDPEPIEDEAPDTFRDLTCIPTPDSGVRVVDEQKLVPYRREFSARAAEIAEALHVRKPSLYTVGLYRVTKAQFAHIARSVGASRVLFIGEPTKFHRAMMDPVDLSFIQTDAEQAIAFANNMLWSGQTVILAGSAVSPVVDGRHGVALATIEAGYEAFHVVPTDDSIIEAAEFQASIDNDCEWSGFVLSEYLAEQAEARAA